VTITKHLFTTNNPEELSRIDEELRRSQRVSREHRRLLKHSNHAHQVAAANSILDKKAQTLNLSIIKVIGDGNCLQYAVNESYRQQTGHYIADNDNLRLLATALTRAHLLNESIHLLNTYLEA
jgi:hypothetical protein